MRTTLRAALAVAIALVMAPAAHAESRPTFPTDSCITSDGGDRVCTAQVPSYDGAPLDVDVTMPHGDAPGGGRHPLIVMLHGFGNDKHEWESTNDTADDRDKYHWNSHWFAQRGYYVLTYTVRGFRTNPPDAPYQPPTPNGTSISVPSGTIQLKTREAEIRDTQWLAAVVAGTFPDVDTDRVAVTGNSYGGGESWLQAAQPRWTFPSTVDPSLPVLHLRVAVPKYGWTDLGYGLAPGGHGPSRYDVSTGRPDDENGRGYPIGAVKLTYTGGFFALGQPPNGFFENGTRTGPYAEGPISIDAWAGRLVGVGDPYDAAGVEDTVVAQARRGLTEFRSAYYQPERFAAEAAADDEVAVFSIQGWTDDLFTSAESFRQYHLLKGIDPHWPVEVALGDVGHSRARNPADTWQYLNSEANGFLRGHLNPSAGADSGVVSVRTSCFGDAPLQHVAARDPAGLGNGTWTLAFEPGALPPESGAGDLDGVATDPIVGPSAVPGTCRMSTEPAHPGRYTARTAPLAQPRTYVGVGELTLDYALSKPTTTTVFARLWDEAPDGQAALVDRGVYRIDPPRYDTQAGTLRLPLHGQHYRFERGHRLRLDLVQLESPAYRQPNVPNTVTFGPPRLELPTLEGGS
jgi:dienelactone hydrolase